MLKCISQISNIKIDRINKDFKVIIFSRDLENLFLNHEPQRFAGDDERRQYKVQSANRIKEQFSNLGFEYTCQELESNNLTPCQTYDEFARNPSVIQGRSTNLNTIIEFFEEDD